MSVEEVVRDFAGIRYQLAVARPLVEDGPTELLGSGLVYRIEDFVFVSHAGVRASEFDS